MSYRSRVSLHVRRDAVLVMLVGSLLLTINPLNVIAAVKPGGVCKQVNQERIAAGKKYVCIKKGKRLIWNRVAPVGVTPPVVQPTPVPSATPADEWIPWGNPVTTSIQRQLASLRSPVSARANMEILAEPGVPTEAVESLKEQHRFMVEAFPQAFVGTREKFVLYRTVAWMKARATELRCPLLNNHVEQGDNPPSMMAGATRCGEFGSDSLEISYINWPSFEKYDPVASRIPSGKDMFAFMVGQESGGSLLKMFYNSSRKLNNLRPVPAWYDEGGQFAFSSVALAVQTRKWRQSSLQQGTVYVCTPGGRLVSLKETSFFDAPSDANGCWYSSGAIATELMIALYGFDAPITWYQKIELAPSANKEQTETAWEKSFKEAFGDSLEDFYSMADAYARYLKSNRIEELPNTLLERLRLRR